MTKIIIITLSTALMLNTHAFKKHMIDHQNVGCPTNSECSKEMGLFYKNWIKILKTKNVKKMQSFYQKNGYPLEVWVKKEHKNKEMILWDSRCRNHNENSVYIKSALIRGKDVTKLSKSKLYDVRHALVLSDKKVSPYIISNTDLPLYSSNKGLVFLKSIEGNYYGHSVSSQGEYTFLKTTEPKEYPRTVSCPKKLKNEYKKIKHTNGLYSGHFCQKLWNKSRKNFDYIMTGWDCN